MKILVWLLTFLSIPVGLFVSIVSYFSHGLGLSGTGFGETMDMIGMFTFAVCIVCAILAIIRLRKKDVKKALACTLIGLGYCVIIIAGFYIDDAVHSMRLEESIANRNEQLYGENWDAAPAIEGIPELYQRVLNKYYAVVRDRWPADQLMDLGAVSMADYYGDAALDNIGFTLIDLNGDSVDELVIGVVAQPDQQGNAIFCIYSDPENPHYSINSVEGDVYYLHSGEAEGTYQAEIAGADRAWMIETADAPNTFDFSLKEGSMDPSERITLELIPFSRYK